MIKHLLFFLSDFCNKETTLNQNTLNQNLETQSTRHDSIQHLGVQENEIDDANRNKSEKKACNFCVESVKQSNIGSIITNSLSACETEQVIKSMLDQEKYHTFKNHPEPTKVFLFPTRYDGECYCSFQNDWLKMFPWLVFRGIADGAFCNPCSLFTKSGNDLGVLVNKSFIMCH